MKKYTSAYFYVIIDGKEKLWHFRFIRLYKTEGESTMRKKEDDRLSKQLGDFGEQLVMFLIGRLYEHRVAYVDHVGADLIATNKSGKKYAISVKSRVFETDGPQQAFDREQQMKLESFAKDFDLIPTVAFVSIDKINTDKDVNIDVYIIELEDFRRLAGQVSGITATGINNEILHFSNALRNQKELQNHKLINFHRLILKASN